MKHTPQGQVFALLVALLIWVGVCWRIYDSSLLDKPAFDFFQFWGVATVQKASGYTLGSPYPSVARYSERLIEYALASADDFPLVAATQRWQTLQGGNPTLRNNGPLLYSLYALLPERYTTAIRLYRGAMLVSFVLGFWFLRHLFPGHAAWLLALAGVSQVGLIPPIADFSNGNVSTFLFSSLVGLVALANLLPSLSSPRRIPVATALGAGLVFLPLFKPIIALPCLLLTVHLLATSDRKAWAALAVGGAGAGLFGFTLPCLFFRTWTVWGDWYQAVWLRNAYTYPIRLGNASLTMLLAEWSETSPKVIALAMGAILVVSLLAVGLRRRTAMGQPSGDPVAWWFALKPPVADPALLVCIGILVTLGMSPLAWPHYYTLAIFPGLWLLSRRGQRGLNFGLVIAFCLACSKGLFALLQNLDPGPLAFSMIAVSWVPLWLGILRVLGAPAAVPHPMTKTEDGSLM